MQDINQYFGEFWHRIPDRIVSGNNNVGRPWSPSTQSTYRISPLRQPIHSSTPPSCSESGQRSRVRNNTSPFTITATQPTSSQNLNRSPLYLDVPNFPLPRPYQNPPNPERLYEDNFALHSRDTVGSPLPALNADASSSSKGLTPGSRPISRLSWGSGGSTASTFPSWPSQNQEGFIDLTTDSSPPTMGPAGRKRPVSRNSSASSSPSTKPKKRVKVGDSPMNEEPQEIDQVDLRDVDDDNGLARVLEQQRLASIKVQQEQADKPVTFSTIQCIICMESMTNVTVTHCGHLFCHTCLMEALIAGEQQSTDPSKGISKCPVCRKKVMRPKDSKASGQIIPLELKVMSRSGAGKKKVQVPMGP